MVTLRVAVDLRIWRVRARIRVFTHIEYSLLSGKTVATKIRTNARKNATQERSRRTVTALLDATAHILVKEGFDKASTNRIAELTGVSVGSLYQYFPSKEAVVAALIDRHRQEIASVIREELAEAMQLPLEQGVRKLVKVAIRAHRVDPALHRALTEQIPRLGRLEKAETFSRENYALFEAYLGRHRKSIRTADLNLAAFVCVTSIEALTHTAVLQRKIGSAEMSEKLVDEATRLIVLYLTEKT